MQNPYSSQGVKFNSIVNTSTNPPQQFFIPNQVNQPPVSTLIGKTSPVTFNTLQNRSTHPETVQVVGKNYQASLQTRGIPINNQYPPQFNQTPNINPQGEIWQNVIKNHQIGGVDGRSTLGKVNVVRNDPMVERPHYQKAYNNPGDRRELAPSSDPPINQTFCTPFLVGIIGLLAFLGFLLCIILAFTTGHSGPFLNGPSLQSSTSLTPSNSNLVTLDAYPISGDSVIVKKTISLDGKEGTPQPTKKQSNTQVSTPKTPITTTTNSGSNLQSKAPAIPSQTNSDKPNEIIPPSQAKPIITPASDSTINSDFQYPPDKTKYGDQAGKSSLTAHKKLHLHIINSA